MNWRSGYQFVGPGGEKVVLPIREILTVLLRDLGYEPVLEQAAVPATIIQSKRYGEGEWKR